MTHYTARVIDDRRLELPQGALNLASPGQEIEIEPIFVRDGEVRSTFEQLAETWKAQTGLLSNTTAIVLNPSYQSIIGLGERAVPLILEALELEDYDEWFWALRSITREDPVPVQYAGDVRKMAEAWLAWGTAKGYRNVSQQNSRQSFQTSLMLDM